jgi:uncharacterized lipoprotein YmbA
MTFGSRQWKRPIAWLGLMLIVVCVGAFVGGCSSFQRPFPTKGRYALNVSAPTSSETPVQTAPTSTAGLRIEPVRVSDPYNGVSFVYRTGELAYTIDYYNEFIAPPAKLLTDAAVAMMRQKNIFSSVVGPWATTDSRWRLESTITSMHGDYRKSSSPQAVIEGHFILIDETPDASRIAGQWTLIATEPMPSTKPEDFAAACCKAFGHMTDQLADAMRQSTVSSNLKG